MKHRLFPVVFFILLVLSGCLSAPPSGGGPAAEEGPAVRQFFAMDTLMSVSVYGPQGEAAVQEAWEVLTGLDRLLSRTSPDSEISALNAHAGDGSWVPLSPETAELLSFARQTAEDLPGAFDCTIAPVMDAWGFGGEDRHVPDAAALSARLALVDSGQLSLDLEAPAGRLEVPGMAVDLGAAAKGYAAGLAAQAVLEAGGESALLDLGRNITVLGEGPSGPSWRVAVKDPQDMERHLGVLSMRDQTASTSGGYERYFEENGVRYHHIIDPKTGYPAESGLLSVTVVAENPALADVLSTALFVAGRDEALSLWRSRTDFELVLCGADGVVTVTEGLEFDFRGEDNGYTCQTARR
jgi:thiamine biosynthesis lipoprotein